jgi:4-amino-4-deoxy-L-arabinose transferase-like glycosyltransferase
MSLSTSMPAVPATQERRKWTEIKLARIPLPVILLGLIVLLAAGLRFYNLSAVGDASQYYTAAVKSMLQSWHNFFFVAAEPGGSVSVDKPPLGLWLQAGSAAIFGVTGVAVVLPQVIAGILSVPVLYALVKRYLGQAAGLIAAFVQAVAPVAIAVERDNTMDATLILFLLLAAWAFIKATESGKLRWLMLGAALVGLGFNTKMMQAFLPVPAFYALYFLGAKVGWKRKLGQLALTTVVLLAVSLSWAVAVVGCRRRPDAG